MSQGWIKLHRRIRDHWLAEEPRTYSKYEAWIYLLMEANHAKGKMLFDGELITIERGSFITSQLKLSAHWGWSRGKVDRFLKLMESEQMIVSKTDSKKTTIYITNYDNYQRNDAADDTSDEIASEQQTDNKQTTDGQPTEQQTDTNKNNQEEIRRNKNDQETLSYEDVIIPREFDQPAVIEAATRFNKHLKKFKKVFEGPQLQAAIADYMSGANHSDLVKDINFSIFNDYRTLCSHLSRKPTPRDASLKLKPSQNVVNQMASDEACRVFLRSTEGDQ